MENLEKHEKFLDRYFTVLIQVEHPEYVLLHFPHVHVRLKNLHDGPELLLLDDAVWTLSEEVVAHLSHFVLVCQENILFTKIKRNLI